MSNNITAWMIKDVITVSPEQTVSEACLLMQKNNISSVIVVRDKKPLGIFTERDLVVKVAALGKSYDVTKLNEVMTTDIKTVGPEAPYKAVYELMRSNNIRHLPIVQNDVLLGMVSLKDLLQFNLKATEQTIVDLTRQLNFVTDLLNQTSDERTRELVEQNAKLQNLVIVDGLTGLYNYRYFEEVIVNEISRAKRYNRCLTILFIDIDHFKHYNDTNGHEQGNILLKQLASILKTTSRQADVLFKTQGIEIVTRYGGEEFVIILPETNKKGGFAKAERILESVRAFPFYNRQAQPNGKVTVSIGVAEHPTDALNWGDLIKKADESLYNAKNSGRDKVL